MHAASQSHVTDVHVSMGTQACSWPFKLQAFRMTWSHVEQGSDMRRTANKQVNRHQQEEAATTAATDSGRTLTEHDQKVSKRDKC